MRKPSEPFLDQGAGSLHALIFPKSYKARTISSVTGEEWTFGNRLSKTNPNTDAIMHIAPGETVTLAEIAGAGCISHIWCAYFSKEPHCLRKIVLRMYWDGEREPSVEAPLGDFFGLGHGMLYLYASRPLAIGTSAGLHTYWQMPFSSSARIEAANEGSRVLDCLYYSIDYRELEALDERIPRFHAQYRQEMPTVLGKTYTVLEAKGRGHYVGCNMSVELAQDKWWGAGDCRIFVDGERNPSVGGTAGEDYFGGAWCYDGPTFSYPYFGCPLKDPESPHKKGAKWNVYRYLIEDPVPFRSAISVEFEVIEDTNEPQLVYRQDNYSSVAYWYQVEPHQKLYVMPPAEQRVPRSA